MSFEVGRLSAALTLDGVSEFHGQLDAAGRKLTETGQRGASFGRAAETAVRTAAGATTGLVAAGGAYLTMLTRTGVAYNSLQQNSRAALKVIMGGTQQANEQMSKLDDFARNSPFSKSVFIQAQQQLLGFGMEAKKVIPTLDAVQQSMAAMGRGNEDITEVVNILANVQSTGKLTAETLNQLGYRGLDAAELIGKGMSKTGNQIKESITKGTLDGREALDVLVTQMQKRFGGAADGVKEQWSGATDRIKAATRDLGAHIAEPFVSAEGGGMAVKWGNQVADVLRAIEKQSIPVMGILTQRGAPLFAGFTRDLDAAKMAIARWNPASLELSLDKLAGHAPGVAALGGALLALGGQVGPLGRMLSILGVSVNPVLAAFVGLTAASPELRGALLELLSAGKPLLPLIGDLAKILSGSLNAALPLVSGGVETLTSVLRPLLQIVAGIPAPVIAGAAAFMAMHRASSVLASPLGQVGNAFKQLMERAAVQSALGETSRGMGLISAASMSAQGAVKGLGNALKTAFLSNPIGIALTAVSIAIGVWASVNAEAQKKVQEHNDAVAELRGTLDKTNGAATDATRQMLEKNLADKGAEELARKLGVSYRDVQEAVMGNAGAYKRVKDAVSEYIAAGEKKSKGGSYLAEDSVAAKNAAFDAKELNAVIEEQIKVQGDAKRAAQERIQSDREYAASQTDSARSTQRFNDALAVARDVTQDAESRLRALKQALDELSGGAKSARQAQTDLNETALGMKETLAQVGENGEKLWKGFISGAGAVDTTTQSGINFERMLDSANDKMLAAAQGAYDSAMEHNDLAGAIKGAQDVAKQHIATMQEQWRQAGIGEEAIKALTKEYFAVPSEVTTAMSLDGVSEAQKQVLGFLGQLMEIPAGKTMTIETEGNEEAIEALRQMGYAVTESPDGKTVTITSQGSDVVTSQLNEIANLQPPDKLFQIDANAADAYSKIDGVNVKVVDKKTAVVWGNNSDATAKIEAINKKRADDKTVTIKGDASNFNSVWGSVVGKVGEAWVNIFGRKGNAAGGMYSAFYQGGAVQARQFAAGGFPSGMYQGVVGGIKKSGIDGTPHVFAERELGVPWEAYISGNPSFRERNIGLALEALRRLAFPVIPATALGGVRQFAAGGGIPPRSTPTPAVAAAPIRSRFERRQRADGPLVGTAIFGEGTTRNDLAEFEEALDRLRRS